MRFFNVWCERAEYAIVVRSDLKGLGLGWALMRYLIDYARSEGLIELHGKLMHANTTMIHMCPELGFSVEPMADDATLYSVVLDLNSKTA